MVDRTACGRGSADGGEQQPTSVRGAVVRRGGWPVAPLMPAVLRA